MSEGKTPPQMEDLGSNPSHWQLAAGLSVPCPREKLIAAPLSPELWGVDMRGQTDVKGVTSCFCLLVFFSDFQDTLGMLVLQFLFQSSAQFGLDPCLCHLL